MKIRVGNYILNSDGLNYWITEAYETKSGKTDERMITGYCWTFEKCRQTFLERRIGGSEATTLEELIEALRAVYDAVDALDKLAFEQGIKRIEDCGKAE